MKKEKNNILLLPGDGVGPEIMAEAVKLIDYFNHENLLDISYDYADIGGVALDNHGVPFPEITLNKALESDCILLGAVGSKQHENNKASLKPEYGLLELRKKLDFFANIRPIFLFEPLIDSSTLKPEIIRNLDIIIIRELISDVYFGEPRGFTREGNDISAFNTMKYSKDEITRITNFAFSIASKRDKKITSVDKANVLETSQLWRETVDSIGSKHADIEINHMYIDNAAMQLIKNPKQFDVILTGNMFGDILSDEASMLTGSIGMLPSASISTNNKGLFEPVHGSAPDIAGQGIVNPIAMILSFSMMLEFSLGEKNLAKEIKSAINTILKNGFLTKDLSTTGKYLSTSQIGDKILESVKDNVN